MSYDKLKCPYVYDRVWLISSYLSLSTLSCYVHSITFKIFSLLGSEL